MCLASLDVDARRQHEPRDHDADVTKTAGATMHHTQDKHLPASRLTRCLLPSSHLTDLCPLLWSQQ